MKNVEIGVVWKVTGHPRSPSLSPFNKAHLASYSTLIETMHLSCTVFTTQCTIVQTAVLRSHVICLSICDIGGS